MCDSQASLRDFLQHLDACPEAVEWVAPYTTLAEAWDACPRGDWMLWLAGKLAGPPDSASRRKLVGAAVECAALVLPVWTARHPDDGRPAEAIAVVRRYAAGDPGVTLSMVRSAIGAVYGAAYGAAAAAYAAVYTADDAAYAAAVAAYAAAAAAADARTEMLHKCADIVRQHYPEPPEVFHAR